MTTATSDGQAKRTGFIEGPLFDTLLLIGAPLFALGLGFVTSRVPPETDRVFFLDQPALMTSMALKTVIHAHLVIVFFRSHGNGAVRARHPLRFYVVPLVLFAGMFFSTTILAVAIVVSTYWDTVHSSLQTFGIGRIYDMKAGADVQRGRQLDIWANYAIYMGPFLCGPIWIAVLQIFMSISEAGVTWAMPLGNALASAQPYFFWPVVVGSLGVGAAYVAVTAARARSGDKISWQKQALFVTTAIASVWAWYANGFGQALLIVNVFHAVQYFAIVWWSERDNLGKLLGTGTFPFARAIAAAALVVAGVAYGFWFAAAGDYWASTPWLKSGVLALTNTVSLLHFWYDGFIWSVRKKHIG